MKIPSLPEPEVQLQGCTRRVCVETVQSPSVIVTERGVVYTFHNKLEKQRTNQSVLRSCILVSTPTIHIAVLFIFSHCKRQSVFLISFFFFLIDKSVVVYRKRDSKKINLSIS